MVLPARLLSARWVLPIVGAPLTDGAVVLDAEDRVVDVGPRARLRHSHPDLPEERANGALLPGLVNAHTHLELSYLSGRIPGGKGFVAWASTVAQATMSGAPEDKRAAAVAAARTAAAAGTAALGDVGNSLTAVRAFSEVGMRGAVFHELLGTRDQRTGDALADAEAERLAFLSEATWPDGVSYVPAPHALFSAGPDLLRRIFATAIRAECPTSVHVAEDEDEVALLRDGSGRWPPVLEALGVLRGSRTPGCGPVPYLASLGAFAGSRPPLLVHMVHANHEDRALARKHAASVVLCPRSNLHIGGRLPDVPALLADGIRLALGTDSLASSPSMSLWGEMAAIAGVFADVAPETWLRAATLGGAEALCQPALGALSCGRRPGIIDVSVEDEQWPLVSLARNPQPTVRWMAHA